ncbi:hypothetical protein ACN4EK_10435 [Pantanalinema rosaneae CENA516]|uniref:HD domain-containing protein n=1 Tax=Pantanalinema rosaneae TaxID=1620701 RepID=UPI003D6FCE11
MAKHPGEVEVALWFHDAVYDVKSQDNELQSALWAKQALLKCGISDEVAERIYALVLATDHSLPPRSADAQLLVDIDLSILGASPERFEQYEVQVRQEYEWVPRSQYSDKRQAILQGFLNRPFIFSTEQFRNQFESQARENLQRSILRLASLH